MDSRKNRSSSTIETNSFFVMPPLAARANPPCLSPQRCRRSAYDDLIYLCQECHQYNAGAV
jgi:hypothetical protein